MGLILLLVSCGSAPSHPTEAVSPAEAGPGATLAPLSPVRVLTRASLDLRGVRPTEAEIEAIEADPAALAATVQGFVHDPRFGARVRSMFADIYLTRQDTFSVTAADYDLPDQAAFAEAIGDEPLRILSTIVEEDLPYTEIVTADWTVVEHQLGAAWPLDYPEGETGWKKAHYTDGRPSAGVLSTNGFWWRYLTNTSNANRGRANAISRILLCTDYLGKSIDFDRDVNLLDEAAVADAVKNNDGCVACHNTLDPLASYLWGFYYVDYQSRSDTTSYHPEREQMWMTTTEVSPAYYGVPGYDLADLGRQIAADPKLPECITQQVVERMLQREVTLADTETLTELREILLNNGLRLRPLFGAVVASELYQAAPADDPRVVGRKMMSPDQLSSAIEDLTGFRFSYLGYDMMRTDTYGLRTLAGGADGLYATRPAESPTATAVLVQARLAEGAARYVVDQDRAQPDAARLLTEVGTTATPQSDPEGFARQIAKLHLRILGTRIEPDGPELAAHLALWEALYAADGDPGAAWAGLISVLLRDPEFLFY